jgi:hypothetical protein
MKKMNGASAHDWFPAVQREVLKVWSRGSIGTKITPPAMNDGLPERVVASSIETDQVNLGHKDRKFILVPAVHPFRRLLASANPFAQWPIIVSSPGQKL